jgi:ribonuclease HI
MDEPWLRGDDNLWMQSPQNQSMYDLCVNDLLLQGLKMWDSHKIHSLFAETVAEQILNMPLFDEVKEDRLVWKFENHGNYTVKSGYNNYLKSKAVGDNVSVEGEWTALWNAAAPPKTKHLLWRVCRGCLPTRVRLRGRYVPCPSECPLCTNNDEDDWHTLFGCCDSQQVWIESGLREVIEPRLLAHNDVKSVIFELCRSESAETIGHFAMVIWCIWNNRNNWVWNGVKDSAKEVAHRASHMIGEWRTVKLVQRNTAGSGVHNDRRVTAAANNDMRVAAAAEHNSSRDRYPSQLLRWQKPRDGWWKCNVDASFSQNPNVVAAGWCLRDHAGSFVAAGSNVCRFSVTAAEGEALALLEAMRETIARGWSNIIFESDSKIVVDAVNSNHQGSSEWSSIISSIRLLLHFHSNFEVKFTKRQANMAAHSLARVACYWPSRMFFNNVPRCIDSIIMNEMS